MTTPDQPSLLTRIALAFRLFFLVLFNAVFAGRVQRLASGDASPRRAARARRAPTPTGRHVAARPTDAALQLLGLLQREGRLIDFLQEDMSELRRRRDRRGRARRARPVPARRSTPHVKLERIRSESRGRAA